jgi:lipopolysaccharide transport system ATP-binding protein
MHYSSGMVVRLGVRDCPALETRLLITDEVSRRGDEIFQKKCIKWLSATAVGGTCCCARRMYHIQTLCSRALDPPRTDRMQGDAFEVTREYLLHEANAAAESAGALAVPGNVPVSRLCGEDAQGRSATRFHGRGCLLRGIAFERMTARGGDGGDRGLNGAGFAACIRRLRFHSRL